MKIDLHIHSKDCSDGRLPLPEIFKEAHQRGIDVISITDHDSIDCQETARALALEYGMKYITGVELNIAFSHPGHLDGKPVSLDMLGYGYDVHDHALGEKLKALREFRRKRAEQILEKINVELIGNHLAPFTNKDMEAIEATVDGAFGRPHLADYLVKKGIVTDRQAAFDQYLVKCNVAKMPVSLAEVSELIRAAGGKLVIAHPNDFKGTSLIAFSKNVKDQIQIIRERMMPYLDGIECWHSSHNPETITGYVAFARQENLLVTGGSDCHQQPIRMGSVKIPDYVADQFLK